MVTPEPKCTWGGKEIGWTTPEGRCCAEDHCALRGRCAEHVQHSAGIVTCPKCIGRTRKDLAAVENLHALMLGEAIEAGLDSEAANLAGPAASVDQVDGKRQLEDAARGWCAYPRDTDDLHPYTVLGRWDLALREDYGPQSDLFISVTRARRYLNGLLSETHFPHTREFEEFAKDVARCRTHLEAVLHDSRTPEQGRPCPRCAEGNALLVEIFAEGETPRAPRLRKRYAEHPKPPHACTQEPLCRYCIDPHRGCRVCTGDRDTWHCPANGEHWWTEHDYRDRVATDYVEHATELPARELAARIGVSLSTVRKWAAREWDETTREWLPPRLVSRRKGADGRKVYPVRAALALATSGASAPREEMDHG